MSGLSTPVPNASTVSTMAGALIPSEIIRLANEVAAKIQSGETIHNLTIGDFDPAIFPIPKELKEGIIKAYEDGHTNYPLANGMPELRKAISRFIEDTLSLSYSPDEILISGGARPLIYGVYKTLIDPGDKVIYPVPSWNNNHYCHLSGAVGIPLEVDVDQNFMPKRKDIEPYISEATLLALCSPQNPTGTVFSKEDLIGICQLVVEENRRRLEQHRKPVYILYDQMYWQLTFGDVIHHDPVSLVPELKNYVVYIDGFSKAFAATGVRVGWSFGPKSIIDKMRAILSHVGAWAPKAEQVACAHFMNDRAAVSNFMNGYKPEIEKRLHALYSGLKKLKDNHYPVDVISPQAAIYLTVSFPWKGKKTKTGTPFLQQEDVTQYLLDECGVAIVPFKAFGASSQSSWYRISVGTLHFESIQSILDSLQAGMDNLQ